MKLPPFIVTLGTWNIVMATNFIYSANETIRDTDVDAQAPLLHLFGTSFKLGSAVLTLGVIAMVLLVLVLWYVLNHTAWGRHVYAVGDDPEAAKLSGIQTKKVLLTVYAICRPDLPPSPPGSRSAATARSRRPRRSPTTTCRPSPRR